MKRLFSLFSICLISICLICIALNGCGYSKAVTKAEPKGFVTERAAGSPGVVTEKTAFQYVWLTTDYPEELQKLRDEGYSLYIAPVGTRYLEMKKENDDMADAIQEVATYLRDQIIEETKGYRKGTVPVMLKDDRSQADFILEIQLTEIGFGSPILYAAAFAAPVPGAGTVYDATFTNVLAMEGRIVHSDGTLVSEFFDRRIPKVRPADLNKALSKSSPLRDISNDWANEFAESLTARLDRETIKGVGMVSLIPW